MKADDPRHGTYAGYQAHRRDGESACDVCKVACAAYSAKHRATGNTNWRAQKYARDRALNALARLHPDDFHRLYVAERMKDRQGATS